MTQMPNRSDLEFDLLDRLQKSLRVSGKSAGQMAADLGVHRNTVGNYLNGRTPLDRRTLVTWAFSTGVPLEWLETGKGSSVGPDDDGGGPDGDTPADLRAAAVARLAAEKRGHAVSGDKHGYAA